jgi:hypothetical protein
MLGTNVDFVTVGGRWLKGKEETVTLHKKTMQLFLKQIHGQPIVFLYNISALI